MIRGTVLTEASSPELKPSLRAVVRKARSSVPPDARQAAARKVAAHVRLILEQQFSKGALAGYVAIGSELDPALAMAEWDGPLCLPRVVGPDMALDFGLWDETHPLTCGAYGIPEPSGLSLRPDILLVPCLGFDRNMMRLGQGGGFYDRTLQALRASGPVLAIGCAFACQELPGLPTLPHDEKLDMIVTENGILTRR